MLITPSNSTSMKSSLAKRQLEDTESIQQFEPVYKRLRTDKGDILLQKSEEQVQTNNLSYDVNPFQNVNKKRCKFELQHELIRGIIMPKSPLRSSNILRKKVSLRCKTSFPKSPLKHFVPDTIKPTSCMKCNNKFFICSFTLSEAEDLQECCRQTVRSYLLQRCIGLPRNTNYDN